MNIAIDIGNSFTHFGIYHAKKLLNSFKIPTHTPINLRKFHLKYLSKIAGDISSSGISSVVPSQNKLWNDYARKYLNLKAIIINYKSKLPIKIRIKNSSTLGSDRICDAVYGYEYFKRRENVIICDLGTANTYEVVLKNGDYIGGIIAPGIVTSAIALSLNTGKLPLLGTGYLRFNKSVIGRNTTGAIQSGLMNYALFATEGIIKSIEKELGMRFKVIITGGSGKAIQKRLSVKSLYKENTVLDGINLILNYQNKRN